MRSSQDGDHPQGQAMGTRLKSAQRYQAGKTTLKLRKMANEGIRAFRAGELLPAEAIAMNMLELDSHSAETDLILANVAENMGDAKTALTRYNLTIARDSKTSPMYLLPQAHPCQSRPDGGNRRLLATITRQRTTAQSFNQHRDD